MKKRILTLSSANMDFVMNISAIPRAGQTVTEKKDYRFVPGGKGANSSVAIQRLGGDCVFCARVGNDANGALLMNVYEKEGIDTRFVVIDAKRPTGLAAIMVEENGTNRIIVYPGANEAVTEDDIDHAMTSYPDALFMQFEINRDAVIYGANKAAEAGIPVFIDAGPGDADFPLDKLPPLEVFSPNETETEIFSGINPNSPENCLKACMRLSRTVKARYFVLKLGERGSYVYDGLYYHCLPGIDTIATDTTAAGDAFSAALTLEYLNTDDIVRAGKYANIVGGLTVRKAGAYSSIPTAAEVKDYIDSKGLDL